MFSRRISPPFWLVGKSLTVLGSRHFGDQPFVEFTGRIVAGGLQLGLKGGHFDEPGQVSSRPNGDGDEGNFDAEDFHIFFVHPQSVDVLGFFPRLEVDDEVGLFLVTDASDAKHRGDVDDADAAHFHVVAGVFDAGSHDVVVVNERDFGDVVGHQAVASFNERQNAFGFANAAFSADDHPDPQNIDHAADFGAARGEHHFQRQRRQVDELHCNERRFEDRHFGPFRRGAKGFVRVQVSGKDNAGKAVGKKLAIAVQPLGGLQRF